MGHPRRPKELGPSPLQQIHHTRPLSLAPSQLAPEMGLVRDPAFWKRFSTAVHRAAEDGGDAESGPKTPASTVDMKYGDQWLTQQHKEKRRCRILCVLITVAVILVVTGAAIAAWYFLNAAR